MDFKAKPSVHFVGIGGESMSALAIYLNYLGVNVSGSDKEINRNSEKLEKLGIEVNIPHRKEKVLGKDFVVKSLAIKDDNEEVAMAKKLGIPILNRGELLGEIASRHKYTIAVSGSHGKSTTTAMISKILLDFGLNPAIHIGANFPYIGGNVRFSSSEYFVTEACEYMGAFLSLNPYITVITNMELDHPDCYKTKEELYFAYKKLAEKTKGITLVGGKDKDKICVHNALTVGIGESSYYGTRNLIEKDGFYSFDFFVAGKDNGRVNLCQKGKVNVENALFALAVSDIVGVPFLRAKDAIESFSGIARRQEKLFDGSIEVYSDYSHHPMQVKSVAESFKKTDGRLIGIFQPHTYSRTKAYIEDFKTCFFGFDEIYILPTFAAREIKDEAGDEVALFNAIENKNKYLTNISEINKMLLSNVVEKDTVVFMGAGSIDKTAREFAEMLRKYVANQQVLC